MGFFENAYDFEVTGGTFYDIRGDQINRTNDNSLKVGGTGNKTQISPNLSHQDNRAYNHQEEQYTAYRGPMESQHSTYPGYGHAPPAAPGMTSQAYSSPEQPPMDPQLYHQWLQWLEFKRWQEWQQFQQQQQQQQQQQYPQHVPQQAPPAAQSQEHAGPQQQPSQTASTATHQSHPSQNTSADVQQALLEAGEDSEVENIRYNLQHQHISEQFEYAYAGGPSQRSTMRNANYERF